MLDFMGFFNPYDKVMRGSIMPYPVAMDQGVCMLQLKSGDSVVGVDLTGYPNKATLKSVNPIDVGNASAYYPIADSTGNICTIDPVGESRFIWIDPNWTVGFEFLGFDFATGDTGAVIPFYIRSVY